jgi:hypothetical protein
MVIVGVVLVIALFLGGRRAVIHYRAHGVGKRYALFFSTLANRPIRVLDPKKALKYEADIKPKGPYQHYIY